MPFVEISQSEWLILNISHSDWLNLVESIGVKNKQSCQLFGKM